MTANSAKDNTARKAKAGAYQEISTVRSACTAFSWNMDGSCQGVRLESRSGGRFRIAEFWNSVVKQGAQKPGEALANTLAEGRRHLAVNEASYCLATPNGSGWGMADVEMPALKGPELKAALAFELRKRTPLPAEQLEWGYRLIETLNGTPKRIRLRIFYVKKDVWRKWLSAATGLSKVDVLAPAPVLLDPIFSNVAISFPGKGSFEYAPGEKGREAIPCKLADDATLSTLLPFEKLDLGGIGSLPESEQLAFMPAIVAAAYGLTRNVSQDADTLPAIPQELKTKRYQFCKFVASALCAFIVICLAYGLMQGFQTRKMRLRLIQQDIKSVEANIKSYQSNSKSKYAEVAKVLEDEMERYNSNVPSVSDVLIELTKLTKAPAWFAGPFSWNMEAGSSVVPITFVLREPLNDTSNTEFVFQLNNSPILGDAVENKSVNNKEGYMERRFVLKARYDTPEEMKSLEAYLQKQKQEQEQKRRKELEEARKANNEVGGASAEPMDEIIEEE